MVGGVVAGACLLATVALTACGIVADGAEEPPTKPTGTPPATLSPTGGDGDAASDGQRSLRFSAVGDIGLYEQSGAVLDAIGSRSDDLTLVVGDLSYRDPGEEQEWCRFVTDRVGTDYPFQLVAGNHEDDGPDGSIDVFRECLPNHLPGLVGDYGKQWYADVPVDDPLVRFVMISPNLKFDTGLDGTSGERLTYEADTAEFAWTRDAVSGARRDGIPWVVVGMHKPCLSVGRYDCESGPDLMNMLLAEEVDLVVAGHEHMYQRTLPITLGPGCPRVQPGSFQPACVGAAGGTIFATVGSGGRELREADAGDPERPWFAAVSAADLDPAYGSLSVEVTDDSLAARFEPVLGAAFTDAFSIER